MKPRFRPLDFIICGIAIAVALLSLLLLTKSDAAVVTVRQNGIVLYEGDILTDKTVEADGNTIEIKGGRVRIIYATCPDHLCMHGYATAAHPLVCLPNRLTVTVSGRAEGGYDAISQ